MTEQAEIHDDEMGQAIDILTSLGFGPAGIKQMLGKHKALDVLAADEVYRQRVEDGRPIRDARGYFTSILDGKKGGGTRPAPLPDAWLISAEDRKTAWIEQCRGCVAAAELMPSYLRATADLAANAGMNHGTIDPTLKQIVEDWESEIKRRVMEHVGEAASPNRRRERPAETPKQLTAAEFNAERQRQLAVARAAAPALPFTVVPVKGVSQ